MPTVIEELNGEVTLDRAHVQERVEEWRTRLSRLYDNVVSWVPPQVTSDTSKFVEMNEELMRAYGVAPVNLPILRLSDGNGDIARLMPRGLWIVGANGRVDLFTRRSQFLLVDRSEYFESARWEIAPALDRLEAKPLSRDALLQAIE